MGTIWTPNIRPHFNSNDLIKRAEAKGYHITGSLIRDWVQLGLLDKPRKKGQGKGKGTEAWWSQRQVELLLTLLEQRQRGHVQSVAALCNIPVFGWLYWADASGAPLRQVKRAVATWQRAAHVPRSYKKAHEIATVFVRNHTHPHAKGARREVSEALTTMIYSGEYPNDLLRYHLQTIIDPSGKGEERGPADAPLSMESTAWMIEARLRAATDLHDAPDELWEWARVVYHWTMSQYQARYDEFAANADTGHLFPRPTFEYIAPNTCNFLITQLGVGLRILQEDLNCDGLPPELHPSAWTEGIMHAHQQMEPSPYVLPSGQHPSYLRIEAFPHNPGSANPKP